MGPLMLKSLHLLGVVLFLGNIVVTALWKMLADRTRNPAVIAYAQRLVTTTDVAFTATGAALILATGHLMAGGHAAIFATPWLRWGFLLFAASGLLWILALIPIQLAQSRLARGFATATEVPARYWQLARWWALVGTVATVLPLINLYLMVHKPGN
jgi:uncharacterized membrane protein